MSRTEAYNYIRRVLINERLMRKRVFKRPDQELLRRRKVEEIDQALDALDNIAHGAGVTTAAEAAEAAEAQPSLFT